MLRVLIKDSALYFAGGLFVQAAGLVSLIVMMKTLSVAEFGLYSYAVVFVAFFAFVADGGLTQFAVREVAQNPGRQAEIYERLQSAQVLISILIAAGLAVASYAFNSKTDFVIVMLLGGAAVLNGLMAPVFSVFIARGDKWLVLGKDILVSLVRLSVVVCVAVLSPSPHLYAAAAIACAVTTISFCLVLRRRADCTFILRFRFSLKSAIAILRAALPLTLLMLVNILYNKIDVIMLNRIAGQYEVGLYAGATQFIYPFMFVSSALATALFPHLSKTAQALASFQKVRRNALKIMGISGLALSLLLFVGSEHFFRLVFDGKYDGSVPVFKLLVWYLFIVFTYGCFSNDLVARGKTVFLLKVNILMLFVNVALNAILLGRYGALGAAGSTLFCELVLCIVIVLRAKHEDRSQWYEQNLQVTGK